MFSLWPTEKIPANIHQKTFKKNETHKGHWSPWRRLWCYLSATGMFSIIFHCINNIRQRVRYKYRPDCTNLEKLIKLASLTEIGLASSGLGEPWPRAAIFSKTTLWSMSIRWVVSRIVWHIVLKVMQAWIHNVVRQGMPATHACHTVRL